MNFKENETTQKLRGGYYTPKDIAGFLTAWVAKREPASILEPSCGDGIFLKVIPHHLRAAKVTAFEIDADEAAKASQMATDSELGEADVRHEDFLGWAANALRSRGKGRFDAVVGNPPFIRYQYLPQEFQDRAEHIFRAEHCKFTKHTNAWVPFVLASLALLRRGGRLAMVVPSELIHVAHAQSLRAYLGQNCRRVILVDPEELWFPGTLQGAALLLAEKKEHEQDQSEGLAIVSVRGRQFVRTDPDELFENADFANGKTVEGKWTRALLRPCTRTLLNDLVENPAVARFQDVADVDVGIVTGANRFFLVNDEDVERYGLQSWVHPMFGRSAHCPGVIYDRTQHDANAAKGYPTNFVWFQDSSAAADQLGNAYIEMGESNDLHTRYKCRIRTPWYSVPSVYATDIGMLKRSHDTPRLIHNRLRAYTTDTAYRIRPISTTANALVFTFLNALTALSAELEGRHYGGGVLELVPSEIEKLLLPTPPAITPDLEALDRDVRTTSMIDVLEKQSRETLGAIGLGSEEQHNLISSWQRMRDRRCRVASTASN